MTNSISAIAFCHQIAHLLVVIYGEKKYDDNGRKLCTLIWLNKNSLRIHTDFDSKFIYIPSSVYAYKLG